MSSLLKTSFWYEWGNILALSAHESCNITKYWGPIWKILFCFSSYFKISFLILRENDTSNPNYYYFHQLIFLLITEINKDIKKEKTSNHDFIT